LIFVVAAGQVRVAAAPGFRFLLPPPHEALDFQDRRHPGPGRREAIDFVCVLSYPAVAAVFISADGRCALVLALQPEGLDDATSFVIAESAVVGDNVCIFLGDLVLVTFLVADEVSARTLKNQP
jgi:hypothetical protein